MAIGPAELEKWFEDQAPRSVRPEKLAAVRMAGKSLAYVILGNTPSGPDQESALRLVREAVAQAKAALAGEG